MVKAQQTFVNETKHPVYVTIEPVCNPCWLQPGDWLTLIYTVPSAGDALRITFCDADCLLLDPIGALEHEVLVNGQSAEDLSWKFKR